MEPGRWVYRDNSRSRDIDRGVKIGGAMRSKPVFDPDVTTQRLNLLTRPLCNCWYGNTLSLARRRYTGITLVLEKKWYTYDIHAK